MASDPIPTAPCSEDPRSCPECAYALTGLPSEGTCPECGTRYDSRAIVLFGWPRGGTPAGLVIWSLLFTAVGLGFFASPRWCGAPARAVAWPAGLLYLGAAVSAVVQCLAQTRPGSVRVRLTPEGCAQGRTPKNPLFEFLGGLLLVAIVLIAAGEEGISWEHLDPPASARERAEAGSESGEHK